MSDDTSTPFLFPAVGRKKVTAAFDGGRITSDGGVMLLAAAERRLGIADRLAALIADPRNPAFVTHSVADILRARMLAIACGYEDADDLDHLRTDPGFKLACGRLPDSGRDLCSQPTVSRWENAPTLREVVRLSYALVDAYCASYARPPAAVTLDIDDTVDVVHGHQQLALFNAHHDERCFMPIHVYDTATSRPVAILLRPGKTPSGPEVQRHIRRLVRRIRRHWPCTRLTVRGDGHYGRPEVMAWCEAERGRLHLRPAGQRRAGPAVRPRGRRRPDPARRSARSGWGAGAAPLCRIALRRQVLGLRTPGRGQDGGHHARARHALRGHQPALRQRRVAVRHPLLRPRPGREPDQAAQGPARFRPHQLSLANQVRLVLHTAAYWLMLTVRDAIPRSSRSPPPSSRHCGCACSRSPDASPRPLRASASPLPPPARRPTCSAASRAACNPLDHDGRGTAPDLAPSRQPQRPAPPARS